MARRQLLVAAPQEEGSEKQGWNTSHPLPAAVQRTGPGRSGCPRLAREACQRGCGPCPGPHTAPGESLPGAQASGEEALSEPKRFVPPSIPFCFISVAKSQIRFHVFSQRY